MTDREMPTGDVLTTGAGPRGHAARPGSPVSGAGRGQAMLGVLAGLLVVAVITGVFIVLRAGGGDQTTPAPAAPQPAASAAPTGPALDPALQKKPDVRAGTGTVTALKVENLVRGSGPAVTPGQVITVHYVGVLYGTGKQFDSSWDRGRPVQFPIGTGNV